MNQNQVSQDLVWVEGNIYGFPFDFGFEDPDEMLEIIAKYDKANGMSLNQCLARIEAEGKELKLTDEEREYMRREVIKAW